jgi:hypothetical protein
MAQPVEISCVNKRPRNDPHERISYLGGINPDGTRWKTTLDRAIQGIEGGEWSFWTMGGGKRANVILALHNGHKYLKTVPDGVQPDNLLALPECS